MALVKLQPGYFGVDLVYLEYPPPRVGGEGSGKENCVLCMKSLQRAFDKLAWTARIGWIKNLREDLSLEEIQRYLSSLEYRFGLDQVEQAVDLAMDRFDPPKNVLGYIESTARNLADLEFDRRAEKPKDSTTQQPRGLKGEIRKT